jgi:beta-mannosidase
LIEKLSLNGQWQLKNGDKDLDLPAEVPGTVFETLLKENLIEDPFYGINEKDMDWVFNSEWEYCYEFDAPNKIFSKHCQFLYFYGLDTVADIYLNQELLASVNNMHRTYKFPVKSLLKETKNLLQIKFKSPVKEAMKEAIEFGVKLANGMANTVGVPFIRKAQYSYGWDWGPSLPDIGIWRPVEIIAYDSVQLSSVYINQEFQFSHNPSGISLEELPSLKILDVNLNVSIELESELKNSELSEYSVQLKIVDPQNSEIIIEKSKISLENLSFQINLKDPKLWWTHDLGDQPLYQMEISILSSTNSDIIDSNVEIFGIRDIQLIRNKDRWGECFYFRLNGIPVFMKGANWIPIDNFIPRGKKLNLYEQNLLFAKEANMNMMRVWGGGIYEEDLFYDLCDKMGILVWQDFLFACSVYPPIDEFNKNVKLEAIDNIKRLRNHPSLALWCGNNEVEQLYLYYSRIIWKPKMRRKFKQAYLYIFEELLPKLVKQFDPYHAYWPSSPSNGGGKRKRGLIHSSSPNYGDSHYWMVWHGGRPFSAYRKFFSRFMSEYGFESFPSMVTIKEFSTEKDYDFLSPIMENHQKNRAGNKKIMDYMKKRFSIPATFEQQVQLSQLTQAEAIEYGVEHWRRNRNDFRCMGSLYWQLNDCWPVASWASLDYYVRWKALHYFAKRFYDSIFPSVVESPKKIEFWLTNDYNFSLEGIFNWQIMDQSGKVIKQNLLEIQIGPCQSKIIEAQLLKTLIPDLNKDGLKKIITFYRFTPKEIISKSNSYLNSDPRFGFRLFSDPKNFELKKPIFNVNSEIETSGENSFLRVKIHSEDIALFIYFESNDCDFIASDNYFSMYPGQNREITLRIQEIHDKKIIDELGSLKQLQYTLQIKSLYDLR